MTKNFFIIDGATSIVEMYLSGTNGAGQSTIVDLADWITLCDYSWSIHATGCAQTKILSKQVYMHRLLCGTVEHISHKNGDKLDNRRANLQSRSRHEISRGIGKVQHASSSRYKGVHWHTGDQRWRAKIKKNGKEVYLGGYQSEAEAARAYNEYVQEVYGENAVVNKITTDEQNYDWCRCQVAKMLRMIYSVIARSVSTAKKGT